MKKRIFLLFSCIIFSAILFSQACLPAAYRTKAYIPLLKGKRVAVFANQTATIGQTHLVDSLLKLGIHIVKVFGPEHGFRGVTDDGAKIDNYTDEKTGLPIISLYGAKNKPSVEDLKDVDIMLYDIQDVGTRFYTFIASMQRYLEAALENSIPLIILDRPNPNGFYVDGPVLDTAFKSFVGLQPIPSVYGLTIGEYARMIAGEQWLSSKAANEKYQYYLHAKNTKDTAFHFLVIKCDNYTHKTKYQLPIAPSPNIPDMSCVYWYASNCLFEGTILSEGRGTDHPFCTFGHPSLPKDLFAFTPTSRPGAKEPKLKNQVCYGWNLYHANPEDALKEINNRIQLKYLLEAYRLFPDKETFFLKNKPKNGKTSYGINRLAGNDELVQQIIAGKTEEEIRASWQPKLNAYKIIRKKYLLYKDFE